MLCSGAESSATISMWALVPLWSQIFSYQSRSLWDTQGHFFFFCAVNMHGLLQLQEECSQQRGTLATLQNYSYSYSSYLLCFIFVLLIYFLSTLTAVKSIFFGGGSMSASSNIFSDGRLLQNCMDSINSVFEEKENIFHSFNVILRRCREVFDSSKKENNETHSTYFCLSGAVVMTFRSQRRENLSSEHF